MTSGRPRRREAPPLPLFRTACADVVGKGRPARESPADPRRARRQRSRASSITGSVSCPSASERRAALPEIGKSADARPWGGAVADRGGATCYMLLGGPMSVLMKWKCPDCGRLARWSQRWRWSGVLGQRRVAPCPFCGASLRISASMRVVNLAVICSLLMQVADYTILRRVDASAGSVSVRGALLMIRMGLLVVLVVAFSRTRLERHPTSTVTP